MKSPDDQQTPAVLSYASTQAPQSPGPTALQVVLETCLALALVATTFGLPVLLFEKFHMSRLFTWGAVIISDAILAALSWYFPPFRGSTAARGFSGVGQMTVAATQLITAADLLKMGDIGRCELIYGELVMMSPAGLGHGEIALRIGRLIGNFVEEHDLGVVLAAETGYIVESNPDLVRAPDVSFVRKDRLPPSAWNKFFPGVPDLAIEVLSPEDSKRGVAEKVNMWLAHGTVSVWVVDPAALTITLHRTGERPVCFNALETLLAETTLPGFVLPLIKVFRRP